VCSVKYQRFNTDNEKTPQPTKGQRYDRLKRKRIFQTSWKEKITWIEESGRLINLAI
jgi:hypothetical protein